MEYIEAVGPFEGGSKSLFLAGGITNCPDWQQSMVDLLRRQELVILNPRRKDFPIDDPSAAEEQIRWEHKMLRLADAVCFWFPCETLCPIVLYELGALSMTEKPIFVGMHPDYQRRQDVEIQTQLVRPDVEVVFSAKDFADQITCWAENS